MTLNYYDLTVPLLIKNVQSLKHFFEKGWAAAQESGLSEADFLGHTLAPDMFPLIKQIQIATDNAKAIPARLSGRDMIKLEDTETTVAELHARIDTVLEHLSTYTPEQFVAAEEKKITLPYIPGQYVEAKDYLLDFALPNFFFHMTTAYAIIRTQGVPLGKMDFVGNQKLHPIV